MALCFSEPIYRSHNLKAGEFQIPSWEKDSGRMIDDSMDFSGSNIKGGRCGR